MANQKLRELEAQIDALIYRAEKLKQSNQQLRDRQAELIQEREGLTEKHQKVRTKLNNLLKRLKNMEATS